MKLPDRGTPPHRQITNRSTWWRSNDPMWIVLRHGEAHAAAADRDPRPVATDRAVAAVVAAQRRRSGAPSPWPMGAPVCFWGRESRHMTNVVLVGTGHDTPPGSSSRPDNQPQDPPGARQILVEFRALGPVEALVAGRMVDLGAPKQRALLALLLTRVGQPVAVDVLLEALWAGHPPPSAMTSLQAYVANLRRVLEPR